MMTFKRTVTCGICGIEHTEPEPNYGFKDWGCIEGVELNEQANPMLCPAHLKKVMDFIDSEVM